MSLDVGTRLGSLEITALIGKGGMGEVYRARDTKLKRDVAIKTLSDEFSYDPDRLSRFQREAELLASLNHPNIAAIYDLSGAEGSRFLVLELVEGRTLAERIQDGPIPVDETLTISKSICEALEVAHEQGIVHLDLKPANIKITPDGRVKVLDFGLAKAMESAPATTLSNSPTLLSVAASNAGVILGTAAYMSPEQAKGRPVDKRADIWAFGVVLYEMLTGRMLFSDETASETMAFVMTRDPDWSTLPANTPTRLRELLRRCLTKDPQNRLQAIGEARITIHEVLNNPRDEHVAITRSISRGRFAWAVVFLFTVAFAVALVFLVRPAAISPKMQLEVTTPPTSDPSSVAISPDGANLAFVAASEGRSRLWLRPLGSASAQPLARTEDASFPFWSPDSHSIGFFSQDKIKTIDIGSGTVQAITAAAIPRGATWSGDGTILFGTPAGPIFGVSASGGMAIPVTKLKRPEEAFHGFPYFLPDGHRFLFSALLVNGGMFRLYAASLDGGERVPTCF